MNIDYLILKGIIIEYFNMTLKIFVVQRYILKIYRWNDTISEVCFKIKQWVCRGRNIDDCPWVGNCQSARWEWRFICYFYFIYVWNFHRLKCFLKTKISIPPRITEQFYQQNELFLFFKITYYTGTRGLIMPWRNSEATLG